jgi:NADH dehydrogenase FAD-containing subunit
MAESEKTHRVVIDGAGFAGFNAARELVQLVGATAEVVVINSTDYFLYLPLMPRVAGGIVQPRHICVSLPRGLRKARFVLGTVDHVDSRQKVVSWSGPEGASGQAGYDRLILTAGRVNRLLPIPGVAAYVHGFRSIAEAICLRDHITRQLGLAEVATDPHERAAWCTFVVIGAGYTGTEVAAQAAGCDQAADARRRRGSRSQASSKLVDHASGLSPLVAGDPSLRAGAGSFRSAAGSCEVGASTLGREPGRQGEVAAKGRARPLAASERMSPPASIERAIQVGSQRGLHGPQSASFDWRGGRHARCHRQ